VVFYCYCFLACFMSSWSEIVIADDEDGLTVPHAVTEVRMDKQCVTVEVDHIASWQGRFSTGNHL